MPAFDLIPPHAMRGSFLSATENETLLKWVLANEAALSVSRVTGDIHRPSGRNARSYYGELPWKFGLVERAKALLPSILPDIGIPVFTPCGFEVELVAYDDQCFIGRHRDTGTGATRHASDRIVSMVYYLHNEPKRFSGGELRLWPLRQAAGNGPVYCDVAPVQNGIVAFPSWAVHEVLPVKVPSRRFADARFAINIWVQRAHF